MPKIIIHKSNKMHSMLYPIIGILCVAFFITAGFFVPEFVIEHLSRKDMSVCRTAPESYYSSSGTAMAKQASERLTAIDRMKIISGIWDSSYIRVPTDCGNVTESCIVELARKKINYFYEENAYPYSLEAAYANWYSWETELYKYTDNIFNTYTVYLWLIHLTKYDNSLTHTILITENGTVLAAEVNDDSHSFSSISKVYLNQDIYNLFGDSGIKCEDIAGTYNVNISGYPFIDMQGINMQNIYQMKLSDRRNDADYYYIYQYKSDGKYGIGIVPAK